MLSIILLWVYNKQNQWTLCGELEYEVKLHGKMKKQSKNKGKYTTIKIISQRLFYAERQENT
jgi:hypothetical protein